MPDQKMIAVSFDRDVIRPTITKLSYTEARRLHGPIYEVLEMELNEAGCHITAEHLNRLAQKERNLLKTQVIAVMVSDEWDFLLALVENCKLAEQAVKLRKCGGVLAALRIAYQSLIMADRFEMKYKWLIEELYEIMMDVLETHMGALDVSCNEIKMRMYYKCGKFLARDGSRHSDAVEHLERALDLARSQIQWAPDTEAEAQMFATMHEACGQALTEALLAYARQMNTRDTTKAIEITRRAILTLVEVGQEKNEVLFYKVNIDMIAFLIDEKQNELALKQIAKIEELLDHANSQNNPDIELLKCKLWLEMGRCYFNFNQFETAMIHLRKGHNHSKEHNFLNVQAQILLYLGRIHARNEHEDAVANDAFSTARKIFIRLNDRSSVKKASYMMAKLKSEQIFPEFLGLVKSKAFCDLYSLRAWKNRCQPFWRVHKTLPSQIYPRPLFLQAPNPSLATRKRSFRESRRQVEPERPKSKVSIADEIAKKLEEKLAKEKSEKSAKEKSEKSAKEKAEEKAEKKVEKSTEESTEKRAEEHAEDEKEKKAVENAEQTTEEIAEKNSTEQRAEEIAEMEADKKVEKDDKSSSVYIGNREEGAAELINGTVEMTKPRWQQQPGAEKTQCLMDEYSPDVGRRNKYSWS